MRTLRRACLLAFMFATAACSTIGHNETFMLQYKKDLHDLYTGQAGTSTRLRRCANGWFWKRSDGSSHTTGTSISLQE